MENQSHQYIASLIKKLNPNDDSIVMTHKIKDLCLEQEFQIYSNQNNTLKDAFQYFNSCALRDTKFGTNLALLFSYRTFDSYVENGSTVRGEMLNTLERNYLNAETLKNENIKHFYNSITLLGEFYNRCRINDAPVGVLACALFELLLKHLDAETNKSVADSSHVIDEEFARLILTQVTLNGLLAKPNHKAAIDSLLFNIRKCLIDVSQLSSNMKALFLMTLDLYNSNFSSLGKELETMYAKFLTYEEPKETSDTQSPADNETGPTTTPNEVNNFSQLCNELSALGAGLSKYKQRINTEYIGRPLKASERLKFAQKQAAMQQNKSETEVQGKLVEKEIPVTNIENTKIIEQQSPSKCPEETSDGPKSLPVKQSDDNQSIVTTKSRQSKERKEDQAYFLVKPSNVRQRLKAAAAAESQPSVTLIDWNDDVENNANNQNSSNILNTSSESTKATQNGYHPSSPDPTSPNENRRGNFLTSSFRSIRSDHSARSIDRYNKRNNYNRSNYQNNQNNQNNSGHYNHHYNSYNNNYQNNRNNYQRQGQVGQRLDDSNQGKNQNQVFRRQNSDFSNQKNENRGNNAGSGYSNNYQQNRSYPSKSFGNRNRHHYQHDDRSITPKPFEAENWDRIVS